MNQKTKSTQEPTTNKTTIRCLSSANYSFDTLRNAWFRGKKPVNEEDVLVWLIRYAKSQNVPNAGEWAAKALESAKHTPELTTGAFVKARMVRNRNRRIAGKFLFAKWARAVGIEIVGSLEDFMRRHSLVVARFYNEIARGFACCKKQARIAGRVMRSVFIGWDIFLPFWPDQLSCCNRYSDRSGIIFWLVLDSKIICFVRWCGVDCRVCLPDHHRIAV